MKLIIALAICSFVAVGTIQAQTTVAPSNVQKVEKVQNIDALASQLGLTVDQKANVGKTLGALQATVARLQRAPITDADKASKIADVRQRMDANLKNYLTEEQYAKYEKLMAASKNF